MRSFHLFVVAMWLAPAVVAIRERPITKVVKLLQGMLEKSKSDGERDTELFAKYKCYCDTNEANKKTAIADFIETIQLLSGEIAGLQGQNGKLSGEHAQLEFDISDNERARTTADTLREKENAAFVAEETDMKAAIEQMDQAVGTLAAIGADQTANTDGANAQFMAGRTNAPVLIKVSANVQKAMDAAAVFLTQKQKRSITAFLQAPFGGTYTSQSGEVVGILKNMRDTFKSNLASARATETSASESYNTLTKVKTDEFDNQKTVLNEHGSILSANDESLSTKKTQKSDAETSMANDQEFLAKLVNICTAKTNEYEDRKMMRANEDAAIAQAVSILNSDAAFENAAGSLAFLQLGRRAKREEPRDDVSKQMLKDAGTHKSGRMAKVAIGLMLGNPFDKVVSELEEMLEIIAKEEKADDEQKAWCDSEREENHGQRNAKKRNMNALDGDITSYLDTLDSEVDGLRKQLRDEQAALAQNRKDQADSIATRTEENGAYQANIGNLVAATKTVETATNVLKKFYEWLHAKNGAHHYEKKAGKDSGGSNIKRIPGASSAQLEEACSADPSCNGFNTDGWLKTKIDSDDKLFDTRSDLFVKTFDEESKVSFSLLQRREDPTPPETFTDGGSSYDGQTGKANDVVSQLEFILSESKAEEKQAHTDEESAQHNFEDEITTLKSQEATSLETIANLEQNVADEEKSLQAARDDHEKTNGEKKAIEGYLTKIRPGCTFITDNIDSRKSNRGMETDSLNNAINKLKSTPQYKEAKAKADAEELGACAEHCVPDREAVPCKACIAGTSVSGYCASHGDEAGCQ